jgi:hypothetical protein
MNSIPDYVDAAAEFLNLPINSDYRPGVIANLEMIADIARLVTEFPLEAEVEPAPIFRPFEGDREDRG